METAGFATISITLSMEITRKVNPPRALYTGLPLGHPLGFPGQAFRQLQVLRYLLRYLAEIESPGTIVKMDLTESGDAEVQCALCSDPFDIDSGAGAASE